MKKILGMEDGRIPHAAFCLSRFTGLSIYAIYFMVMSVDLIKCVIGFVLVKKGVWLQNIVAE